METSVTEKILVFVTLSLAPFSLAETVPKSRRIPQHLTVNSSQTIFGFALLDHIATSVSFPGCKVCP